jgi:hypothetical protein
MKSISHRARTLVATATIAVVLAQPMAAAHASSGSGRVSAGASATAGSTATGSTATGLYQFWSKGETVTSGAAYVIAKGGDVPSTTAKVINYEQSFALNSNEAAVARSKGWLAHTCTGAEIHPGSIKSMTLLDGTIPAAVDWRSSGIAAETNSKPVVGTYLDTMRAIFNPSFYDGAPCTYTEAAWRTGSVDLVNQVRSKTGGKMVIANGAGMASGSAYLKSQSAIDDFLARAHPEAVHMEHFAKTSKNADKDAAFMKTLAAKGIIAFAKCDGVTTLCQSTFDKGVTTSTTGTTSGPGGEAYSSVPR